MAVSTLIDKISNGYSNSSTKGKLKLVDGTLIQWGASSVTTNSSTSSVFKYKGELSVTFDEEFISIPFVLTNVRDSAGYWNSSSSGNTVTAVHLIVAGDKNNATKTVNWLAIGRWK